MLENLENYQTFDYVKTNVFDACKSKTNVTLKFD